MPNEKLKNCTEYISDFESDTTSEVDPNSLASLDEITTLTKDDLFKTKGVNRLAVVGDSKTVFEAQKRKADYAVYRHQILSLNAYERHKKIVNDYLIYYGGSVKDFALSKLNQKTDSDIIKENHRFLWSDEDEPKTWSSKLAKRYWDKLFKEYCLIDLSKYKENKFGMRWRLEKEVIAGKGQFVCANVACDQAEGLRSWEVNFAYRERQKRLNALVKVRLCRPCSDKLNYHHVRREVLPAISNSSNSESALPALFSSTSDDADSRLPAKRRNMGAENSEEADNTDSTARWRIGEEVADVPVIKTREDEFGDYFRDMLL